MNFNMMYKSWKVKAVSFLITLIMIFGHGEMLKAADTVSQDTILVIVSEDESQKKIEEVFSKFTASSMKVTVVRESEAEKVLGQYKKTVCFNLKDTDQEFTERIAQKDINNEILIVGNEFLEKYENEQGRASEYKDIGSDRGEIQTDYGSGLSGLLVKEESNLIFFAEPEEKEGILLVGDFQGGIYEKKGNLAHIAISDISDEDEEDIIFDKILKWNGSDKEKEYLVIEDVYAFQDPDVLLSLVEEEINQKNPFILCVMPVYKNGDYPAMQHFCEVLRYAQANGGSIILGFPLNSGADIDLQGTRESISQTMDIYSKAGVYPLGIEVPENLITNESLMEALEGFSTIIVRKSEQNSADEVRKVLSNESYLDEHTWIWNAGEIFFSEDSEEMKKAVDQWNRTHEKAPDFRTLEHRSEWNNTVILYENGSYSLNGNATDIRYENSENANNQYDYGKNLSDKISKDLTSTNRKLAIAVVVVSIMFVCFLFVARIYNKKKFLISPEKKPEEKLEEKRKKKCQ